MKYGHLLMVPDVELYNSDKLVKFEFVDIHNTLKSTKHFLFCFSLTSPNKICCNLITQIF